MLLYKSARRTLAAGLAETIIEITQNQTRILLENKKKIGIRYLDFLRKITKNYVKFRKFTL